ncbi:hypothetical protein PR002_g23520 [Phytophthora rubi]|uniref:Uncharacterized protein n=1 Tax=Phytophthora rubi TaxID=129364 RepID=A0A6A3IHI7_9STRA|nr:hypothetical protein PR002_g23520 [Phytophthora rubi]
MDAMQSGDGAASASSGPETRGLRVHRQSFCGGDVHLDGDRNFVSVCRGVVEVFGSGGVFRLNTRPAITMCTLGDHRRLER